MAVQCVKPVDLGEGFLVPCGKCLPCRIARSREWATRLMHEAFYHDDNLFVTLTYRDECLPSDLSVRKEHFQLFMKRLRRRLTTKVKYYACGEYGGRFGRPHYHAILFGVSLDWHDFDVAPSKHADLPTYHLLSGPVVEAWPYGFCDGGTVTFDSCRYVAGYIDGKVVAPHVVPGRALPFSLQSTGLGLRYALENGTQLVRDLDCTVHGVHVGLPRYYRKKLEVAPEDLLIKRLESQKGLKRHLSGLTSDEEVERRLMAARKQYLKNLKATIRIRSERSET